MANKSPLVVLINVILIIIAFILGIIYTLFAPENPPNPPVVKASGITLPSQHLSRPADIQGNLQNIQPAATLKPDQLPNVSL